MLVVGAMERESRHAEYRKRKGQDYRENNAARMRAARGARLTEFVGVDGEGTGKGRHHRYVLLRVGTGDALEDSGGIYWRDAFDYLYKQFEVNPGAAYCGYFLGYDFTQILRSLPRDQAWRLLTSAGRATRKPRGRAEHIRSYPVRHGGWEFDMLGYKRLEIRPRDPACDCYQTGIKVRKKCPHKRFPWMSICDSGPFFQMPFLDVVNPLMWEDDPDGPVCTPDEFALVERGKKARADAGLDDDMRMYNALENELLARVLGRLDKGFRSIGIGLRKNEWYGPGAAAQIWMRKENIPRRKELHDIVPRWARELCQASYYGGWFEIFSHGLILKSSWNYDINSAYPFAIKSLPCMLHGKWLRGRNSPPSDAPYILCRATVRSASDRVGAVPHRRKDGSICRPRVSKGWYWLDEIRASERAGLVSTYMVDEWIQYDPCNCPPPAADMQELYDKRREVGKNSATGLAIKLPMNSWYGKAAQSVGKAPFGNWFYASLITSKCRIQILDAIATHPNGADSVLMVATDGICFDKRHPNLPISKKLGEWDEDEYTNLTLFKPGVYWHTKGIEQALKVKTRGVPKRHFVQAIAQVHWRFQEWHYHKGLPVHSGIADFDGGRKRTEEDRLRIETVDGWPYMDIPVDFSMTTALQALMQDNWGIAGKVEDAMIVRHNCDPHEKRANPKWNSKKRRMDSYIHELPKGEIESTPYKKVFVAEHEIGRDGLTPDGAVMTVISQTFDAMRGQRTWDTAGSADDIKWS